MASIKCLQMIEVKEAVRIVTILWYRMQVCTVAWYGLNDCDLNLFEWVKEAVRIVTIL